MRKVALSLMLAASMAATTLGSTAVFASDATPDEIMNKLRKILTLRKMCD